MYCDTTYTLIAGVEVLPPQEGLEPGYVAVSLVPIPASGNRRRPYAGTTRLKPSYGICRDDTTTGMEHFPRKRNKSPFDSIIRTNYDVDASSLDVT